MSRLVVSLSTLTRIAENPIIKRPVRCRLLAQFEDLETRNDPENSVHFCTVLLRDITLLQNGDSIHDYGTGVHFYVGETAYNKLFTKPTLRITSGEPVELDIVFWANETSWEILDIRRLSLGELEDLASFLKDEAGQHFMDLMDSGGHSNT